MANEFRKVTDQNGVDHPVCDDTRMTWEANAVLGAKNLNQSKYTSGSHDGIDFTANADNSITADGTAEGGTQVRPAYTDFYLEAGDYIFNCKNATADFFAFVYNYTTGARVAVAINNDDIAFTLSAYSKVTVVPSTDVGSTVNNVTLYPMIRVAEDTDPTYAVPALTNRKITEKLTPNAIVPFIAGTGYTTQVNEGSKIGNVVDLNIVISSIDTTNADLFVGTMAYPPASQFAFLNVSENAKPYLPLGQAYIRKASNELVIPKGSIMGSGKEARVTGVYLSRD